MTDSLNSSKRIAKNTIVIILSLAINLILGLAFTSAFAKYLGAEGFGIFSFSTSFVGILKVVSDLGLNTVATRDIARDKNKIDLYFTNILIIELVLTILNIFLIFLITKSMNLSSEKIYIILLLTIGLGINAIGGLFTSIYTAYEQRENEAFINIIGMLIYITMGFIGIIFNIDLIKIVALLTGSYLIKIAISYFLMKKRIHRPEIKVRYGIWLELLRGAFPFALTGLFLDIHFNADIIMLSTMTGSDEVVGWYAVAYRFIIILLIIPSAFIGSLWPVISRMHIESQKKTIFIYGKTIKYLLFIALPIAVGTTIIADNIIISLFGNSYSNSITALQILIWAGALIFVTYASGSTLGAINKPELATFCLMACIVVNISLNLILIPSYSFVGAAISTVIAEGFLFILYQFILNKNGININILTLLYKPTIASASMGIIAYIIKIFSNSLSILNQMILVIIASTIIYTFFLIIFNAFEKEDIDIFKSLVRR